MNQKGFFQILFILVLLAGIGVAVYLTQFTQIFKPKASGGASASLYGSTPICELNQPNCKPLSQYPKPANGAIQSLAFLGFNYQPGYTLTNPQGISIASDSLSQAKKNYFAKQMDYLWFDGGSLVTSTGQTGDFTRLKSSITELKTLSRNSGNPNFKIGIHAGAAASSNYLFMIWPYLAEDNFLHTPSGERLSYPGQTLFKFLYLQNPATRARLANGFAEIMGSTPIDGLLFDSFSSPHPVLAQILGDNNCKEPFNCKDPAFWFPYLKQFPRDIKAALPNPPAKDIMYNGIFHFMNNPFAALWDGDMNQGFLEYTDGALMEHVHTILTSEEDFKAYLEAVKNAAAAGKKILFVVQPQMFYQTHATDDVSKRNPTDMTGWQSYLTEHNIANDLNLQRFYLASYLLVQKNPYTYFGYHPSFVYGGDFDVYFYEDWNKNYGNPLGDYQITAAGLYTRDYQNGFVIVNPTTQAQVFEFPDKTKNYLLWDPIAGSGANNAIQVLPKQGLFLFNPKTIQSPSPSTSPSILSRPGDTDNDGDIDIFDYNLVLTEFGKKNDPNTRADLDGDDDVDIFDYNIILTNFGK